MISIKTAVLIAVSGGSLGGLLMALALHAMGVV